MGTDTLKRCSCCGEIKAISEFSRKIKNKEELRSQCKECNKIYNNSKNPKNNPNRMYVNGQYISKNHPLWKAGRFTMLDDSFFLDAKLEEETTTDGLVYIILNEAWPNHVKVGMAKKIDERLSQFQTYSPFRDYIVYHTFRAKDYSKAEKKAHKVMDKRFSREQGEWFRCTPKQAKETLEVLFNENS